MTQQAEKERVEEVVSQEDPAPGGTAEAPPEPAATPEPEPVSVAPAGKESAALPITQAGLDRLGNIEVKAAVELGAAEMLVRQVAALTPGCIIQLDRLVGEPADLTVNGRLFARGDVVVVEDHLGLRITQIAGDEEETDSSE